MFSWIIYHSYLKFLSCSDHKWKISMLFDCGKLHLTADNIVKILYHITYCKQHWENSIHGKLGKLKWLIINQQKTYIHWWTTYQIDLKTIKHHFSWQFSAFCVIISVFLTPIFLSLRSMLLRCVKPVYIIIKIISYSFLSFSGKISLFYIVDNTKWLELETNT